MLKNRKKIIKSKPPLTDKTIKKIHESALRLVREQVKKHSLGRLVFLAFIGTRPWGIAQENVDCDYRGVYSVKSRDKNYISEVYINNHAKDITMADFKDFVKSIFNSRIHSLITINSPVIYISKEFLQFKKWVNSNFSKQIYQTCRTKPHGPGYRKDYLYDFFFIGNGIAILERKKVIANLPELNKKVLKIPAIDKIIEEERKNLPFGTEILAEKIFKQLKARLEKANKKSSLPEKMNEEKLSKLKIFNKITFNFWHWPKGSRGTV